MGFIITRKFGYKPIDDRVFRLKEQAEKYLKDVETMNSQFQYRIREIDMEVPDRGDKPILLF